MEEEVLVTVAAKTASLEDQCREREETFSRLAEKAYSVELSKALLGVADAHRNLRMTLSGEAAKVGVKPVRLPKKNRTPANVEKNIHDRTGMDTDVVHRAALYINRVQDREALITMVATLMANGQWRE